MTKNRKNRVRFTYCIFAVSIGGGSEPDPVLACCCRQQNAIYLPTTAKLIAHRCHRNCLASPAVLTVAGSELHRAARFLIGAANTLRDAASSMTSAANPLRVVAAEAARLRGPAGQLNSAWML